jgi:hypothetical protein
MRWFPRRALKAAIAWAAQGEQALHDNQSHIVPGTTSPVPCAHLLDQDEQRLQRTARILGVRRVRVMSRGTPNQHVDLWAGPLAAAHELAHEEG